MIGMMLAWPSGQASELHLFFELLHRGVGGNRPSSVAGHAMTTQVAGKATMVPSPSATSAFPRLDECTYRLGAPVVLHQGTLKDSRPKDCAIRARRVHTILYVHQLEIVRTVRQVGKDWRYAILSMR